MQHSRGHVGSSSRDAQVLSSLSVSAQDSRGESTASAHRLTPVSHQAGLSGTLSQQPVSHGYIQVVAPLSPQHNHAPFSSPVIQSGAPSAHHYAATGVGVPAVYHMHQQSAPAASSNRGPHHHSHHHHHHHTKSADLTDRKKQRSTSAVAGAGLVNNVPSSLV